MLKGHDERAYYLKELMRLLPRSFEKVREVFRDEYELRELGFEDKADQFREVKFALYFFTFDCRIRNGELIERAILNRKESKILRLRYIRAQTWRQLFNSMGYSPDHCKRIHRDAITKIATQNPDADFKAIYEQERAKLAELLERVGEKLR